MDKISVIIPVYNGEKYIKKCIESILKEKIDNLEIIVINDSSTDNTLKLLKKYKDRIIIKNNKKNCGVSYSRNYGLSIATGEYVMFVDSDDYLPDGSIKYLYDLIKKNKADVVCGSHENSKEIKTYYFNKNDINDIKNKMLTSSNYICNLANLGFAPCKLYKRSIIKDIFFEEKIRFREDTLFNIKVYDKCSKIICSTRKCYCYKLNENSASFKFFEKYINEIDYFFRILENYLNKGIINEKSIEICSLYMYMNYLKHFACCSKLGRNCIDKIHETFNQEIWKKYFYKIKYSDINFKYKILLLSYKNRYKYIIYLLFKINEVLKHEKK